MSFIVNYCKNLTEKEVERFLIIYYCVGVAGFLIPYTRPIFEALIPLSVILNIFLILLFHKTYNKTEIAVFSFIFVFTIAVEAIGTKTGMLFGSYFYGPNLGWKVFDAPILIGANWLVLAYGATAIVRQYPALKKWVPFSAAALMVLFDFIMEPVAMKTGMWDWAGGVVPLQNYFMWFVVAVIVVGLFELFNVKTVKPIAIRLFWVQMVFFLVLNIFL
ncbi:carotenoid biosynthesis protein [Natronoflexus pectinivorans]|uniref:Putative membrane protein n=1 Tax=Natronoflexus pectinivorans TaxID=682526 RepID=A0A4R2GLI1_9BACT|nr:carotenoid biosynthesis protein [Natronoflexus pectinivorans]TCO09852.1 putative membrane protein [Natronoflexus pectinivorans]